MGMSIDTVTKWLEIMRVNLKDFPEVGNDKKIESLDTAISYLGDYQQLIRKYEKIEQILKDIPYGGDATVRRIQEVVEDGLHT